MMLLDQQPERTSRSSTTNQQAASPRSSTVPPSMEEVERLVERKVAEKVEKRTYLFVETFLGQIVLALITGYVTQYLLKKK